MKEGANITGLNTAATLWGSAAVGPALGADLIGEALVAALFVLASNTLLRPVVNRINRRPVKEESSEATYALFVICARSVQPEVREKLVALLDLSVDGCGHSANLSLVESYVCWLERRHVAAVLRREHASPNLFTEIYCEMVRRSLLEQTCDLGRKGS